MGAARGTACRHTFAAFGVQGGVLPQQRHVFRLKTVDQPLCELLVVREHGVHVVVVDGVEGSARRGPTRYPPPTTPCCHWGGGGSGERTGGGGVVQAHFTDAPERVAPVTGAPDGPMGGRGQGGGGDPNIRTSE